MEFPSRIFHPASLNVSPPVCFEVQPHSETGLFPLAWEAAQDLTSPDLERRWQGFRQLKALDAARHSPLVAYLAVTRLTEPDLNLRIQMIGWLGQTLGPDSHGRLLPEAVRQHLTQSLAQVRTRPIYALLQAVQADAGCEPAAVSLLSACAYAGTHLADIAGNRKTPLPVRRLAIHFLAQIGYLDAIPALERLAARLQARLGSQSTLSFIPLDASDEANLLPDVQRALELLKAP